MTALLIAAVFIAALLVGWGLVALAAGSWIHDTNKHTPAVYGNGFNCDHCGRFCKPVLFDDGNTIRLVCPECAEKLAQPRVRRAK